MMKGGVRVWVPYGLCSLSYMWVLGVSLCGSVIVDRAYSLASEGVWVLVSIGHVISRLVSLVVSERLRNVLSLEVGRWPCVDVGFVGFCVAWVVMWQMCS